MKALILCAGLGTRLRPITDSIPKVLVPINGYPLLKYHLDSLKKYGVKDVLINTHYLPEQIKNFIKEYDKANGFLNIETTYEEILLGSAGTLKANQEFFKDEEDFIIIYGDNLTNINYNNLLDFHRQKKGICTIASYYEPHPEKKGIITYDQDMKILSFIEKPAPDQIASHDANAGIFVCNRKIFAYLNEFDKELLDFSFDIFPRLLNSDKKMYLYKMSEFLLDIGTIETYELAQEKIKQIIF